MHEAVSLAWQLSGSGEGHCFVYNSNKETEILSLFFEYFQRSLFSCESQSAGAFLLGVFTSAHILCHDAP